MSVPKHGFTDTVLDILDRNFGGQAKKLLNSSEMLRYLNIKTKAANRGSKSRARLPITMQYMCWLKTI